MTEPHIVVGAGLAGLTAALRLARSGEPVLVLEAAGQAGGRAQSPSPDGYALNLGPHALYATSQRLLGELGVSVTGGAPTEGLAFQLGDRLTPMPTGPLALLAHPRLSVREKWRFGAWLAGTLRGDPARLDGVSVMDWLDAAGLEGLPREFALAFVRVATYANAEAILSAGQVVRQLRGAFEGVLYADKGWGAIVLALRKALDAEGVTVRARARVEGLTIEADAVRAVIVDGVAVDARSVILTTSPKATVTLLGDAAPPSLRAFASAATPLRAACLDVALAALPRPHPTVILGVDRPLYLSVHSNVADLAPDGGAVIHVARYLAPGEAPGPGQRAELEGLLDQAQPGWRAQLVEARYAPLFTVCHAAPTAAMGGTAGRPDVSASGLANLAIAGDWVGAEGHLADAALSSAREAAAFVRSARSPSRSPSLHRCTA